MKIAAKFIQVSNRKKNEKEKGQWSGNNFDSDINLNEETKNFHCQLLAVLRQQNTNITL